MSRNYLTIWQAYEKSQANTTASTKCSLARVNIFSKYSHTKISQYGRFVKHYCNYQQDYYQRWKIKMTWRRFIKPARRTWQNRLASSHSLQCIEWQLMIGRTCKGKTSQRFLCFPSGIVKLTSKLYNHGDLTVKSDTEQHSQYLGNAWKKTFLFPKKHCFAFYCHFLAKTHMRLKSR